MLTAASSAHYYPAMDNELSDLDNRLEQLIGLYNAGKSELHSARARVLALEADNRKLAEKLAFATEKLESLLTRMPEA